MSSAETLLAQAVAALNKGDMRTAAERFERAATVLTAVRPADAALALESASRIRMMLEQPRHAALAIQKAAVLQPDSTRIARLQAELADQTGDVATRRAAWQVVAVRGTREEQRAANVRLGYLAREVVDTASSAKYFGLAAELTDDPDIKIEIEIEVAIAQTQLGEHAAALAVLDRITSPNHAARVLGQRGIIALTSGDEPGALAYAEQARGAAVKIQDVMSYLASSSLIAIIHEQAGRLVEAYDTYIRARESLGQLQGDQAKGLVQPAITLFEERLGKAKFDEVWQDWVTRARARAAKQ